MKTKLLDFLACPICKYYPLDLLILVEKDEIIEGIIFCKECNRWYPIIDEIPNMLPDELRNKQDDLKFLIKWKDSLPKNIVLNGKPFNIGIME